VSATVEELCSRTRAELGAFGELGRLLVVAVDVIAAAAGERGVGVLADPAFALELARVAGGHTSPQLIGQVLDHLRARADLGPVECAAPTVAAVVATYETTALALKAPGTRASYSTWIQRLLAAHGNEPVACVGMGELAALIAAHRGRGSQGGRCAEEMAIAAFRHLWSYLVAEGLAPRNVAAALRKPLRPEPLRRPIRADEAALLRSAARMGRDGLLDETAVTLIERLGLRPVELYRLRVRDVDFARADLVVMGKYDRRRRLPLPPALTTLLERYFTARDLDRVGAAVSDSLLLRPRYGTAGVSRAWIDGLFPRLLGLAPALRARAGLSLYSYRHALASWVDPRFGRAVTRRILGHSSRFSVTDQYVHATDEAVREAICAYEEHLLAEFGR
jgi:integrase